MKKLSLDQKAFTIIEVMIVLAIAGVIILALFLAIPALQRNNRNTQRRADVAAALSSIQETQNNNNGQLPATPAAGVANAKFAFYTTPAFADFTGSTTATASVATITSTDAGVVIQNFFRCPAAMPAVGTADIGNGGGASRRNIAAVFRVETANNFQVQCIDM